MVVGYNISITGSNLVNVGTAIRWIAGDQVSPMPPEVEVILIMNEPTVGTGYIHAHSYLPAPGTGFSQQYVITRPIDNIATSDGMTFLTADAALTLLQDGTVTGFKVVL
jgi:hypothetical protein